MRKSIISVISAIVGPLLIASCAPELPVSRPPEYVKPLKFTLDDSKTITFSNQNNIKTVTRCQPGDSVTVYLPTTYTGAYIYSTTYEWTTDSELLKGSKRVVIAPCEPDSLPPKWTFVAPESPGKYVVYFRASYKYSASTERGEIYGGYPTASGPNGYEGEGKKSSVYGVLTVE